MGLQQVEVPKAEPPIGQLTQIAQAPTSPRSHQLWSLYTLMRLGVDVDAILAATPDLRVPLPAIVPPVVRRLYAIGPKPLTPRRMCAG